MTQKLLIYVASDIDEAGVAALRELISSLAQSTSWKVSAPTFVHDVDSESATRAEDEPIVTVGFS